MTNKIKQQMLDRLGTPDLSALEVEAALNVLLILDAHPDLLSAENENASPFAQIPEPPKQDAPAITVDVLRAKIVEKRDRAGLDVRSFLSDNGYAKLSDVLESDYARLYDALEGIADA